VTELKANKLNKKVSRKIIAFFDMSATRGLEIKREREGDYIIFSQETMD
jgi:hypothetical protein